MSATSGTDWLSLIDSDRLKADFCPDRLTEAERVCLMRVRAGDHSLSWLAADGLNSSEFQGLLMRARTKLKARSVHGAVVAAIRHQMLDPA
ncbi:MAG: hypothetical protein R3360_03765 [Alphaproteobacteria bacterium]|nr:hypothetical protein [Alphaproteobacteria bacterium]